MNGERKPEPPYWAGNDFRGSKVEGVKYIFQPRSWRVIRAVPVPEPKKRYLP